MKNYKPTYNFLFKYGLKFRNNSWTISLSLYGSTIGVMRFPQFIINNQYKTLPRPYSPYKTGNKGWRVLQFFEFVRSLEQITIEYFETIYPNRKNQKQYYIW